MIQSFGTLVTDDPVVKKILSVPEFVEWGEVGDKPTMIVGYNFVKRLYPNQSILEHKISSNIEWCFSPFEKRDDCNSSLESFYSRIIKKVVENIPYTVFNIFIATFEDVHYALQHIRSCQKIYVYLHHNNMFYIYSPKEGVVGVSVEDLEYAGYDKERILKLFYGYDNEVFYDMELSDTMKMLLKDNIYLIPYLKSLKIKE